MDYGFKRAGMTFSLMLICILSFSNAFSQTCIGDPNSMVLDDDGDGYKNGDETQNLTDKCSSASVPFDFDHDYSSDLLDADDDNDGISDITDKFAQDASNGTTTTIPVIYNYNGADNGGIRGWGYTGLMNNGTDYMSLYNVADLSVGGAAKKFKVNNIPANDALGATNNQKNAFQFGVNSGAFPFSFVVNGRVMAPFASLTPADFRSMGIFMGTGDQDNYLKMVCAANGGAGGIEIVKEVAGVAASTMYSVPILGSTHVNLYLTVNPSTQMVQPSYSIGGGLKTNMGPAIAVPASWISNVLAVGIISTSRGATPFPATWDYIAVQPVQGAGDWVNVNTGNTCNARHESAFVQAGTKFYLLGGRGTKPVDIYNYGTKTWSTGATPPIQLHHFQAVELNGLIYAVCAFTGNLPNEIPVANVYIYDPVANVWHVGMEIPEARRRGSAGAIAYNGKIYVVSGLTNGHVSGWVNYVDEFDPKTNTWKVLPDAPHSRDHFQLALHGDKIYCIGGRNSGFGGSTYAHTIAETDIYDITDQSWSTLASPEGDIPTDRAGCLAATMGDEIILIGGESMAQTGSHNQTEALNVNSKTWRTLDNLNTGRHSTQAIVSNFGIYTAAGCGSRGTTPELNSLEAFYLYGTTNPTGTSITKGALTVSTSNMNFGNANLGVTNTQTLTLTNPSGNQALLIKVFQLSGGGNFSFNFPSNLPVALNPGESLSVSIKFTPASLGNKNGTFSITHNGTNGANTIINLSGNGTSPQNSSQGYLTAVPSPIVFQQTDVNVISAPITVSLTNTGGASLTINSASITGTNAANFLHNFTGPVTVSAGSTHTFNVTFNPSASGSRTATLSVNHSGVNSPLNISLSGTGTSTTAPCGYYAEQNGLLVVEIESAPASQGWTPETYYTNYTGTEYYTWNGPRYLHEKGHGMLTYQFKIDDPGKYRFKMRTRNGGPLNTHNNDVWVRFPDHGVTFEKNGAVVQEKSGWWKAWQNNLGVWTYNTWAGESTFWEIYVEFPFAGVYNFEISGRDQLFSMDRFVLYRPDMIGDWSATAANPPASPWENCPSTPLVWYRDKDLDYYGNPLDSLISVSKPGVGWCWNNTDCDDNRKSVYPGAPEKLDGRDNDCNGQKDEGAYLTSLNINCGGSTYINLDGDTFESDRLFTPLSSGSKYYNGMGDVLNSDDDILYKSERSVGQYNNYLSYNFQCTSPGAYSVKLYFAETGTVTNPGQRVFDVYIDDSLYINDLDILATAGYMTALTYTFNLPVFDGQLNIKFVDVVGKGKINAIQVAKLPNVPPTFTLSGSSTANEDFTGVKIMTVVPTPVPSYEASWQTTTYSLSPASVPFANVSINPATGEVQITSIPDMVGQQQFTIIANDGQTANNTATKTFTLKVLAVNDAPVFNLSGDVTVNEDFAGTQIESVIPAAVPADEAGQVVTYSLLPSSVSFADVSINSTTGAVSISAIADKSGSQVFTVTANDGQVLNNSYSKTFSLTVNSVNDAPVMDAISDMTINEDDGIQVVNLSGINAGPLESQTLSISAVSDDASLIANPSVNYISANTFGSLSFIPVANKSGVANITVTLSDGNLSFNRMFMVTVNPVNDAPAFTLSGDVTVNEDFATAQQATVSLGFVPADEMSQMVSYSLSPASVSFANVSINSASGEVSITSIANSFGSQMFTVTADDGQSENNTYSQTFILTVNSVNDAPVFTLSGDVNVNEDFASTESVTMMPAPIPADEVGQVVNYSLSPSSVSFAVVSINSNTGEVTITSVADAFGSQIFTITANDGQSENNTYSQTFMLTVNSVNDEPAFNLSGDVNVNEDFASTESVTMMPAPIPADEVGQVVNYSLSPSSVSFANVSINSATGEVTISSITNASGSQMFTVTANDGQSQNNSYSQTFMLTVNSVNDAPVFTLSGDMTLNEDFNTTEVVTMAPGFVPADELSQVVSYSLTPSSVDFANVSINSMTGEVTVTSISNAFGSQLFTVTSDDGQSENNTHSATFMLTINSINDAPVFTLNGDVVVDEDFSTTEHVILAPGFVPADELAQTVVYSLSPASISFASVSINSATGEVSITSIADVSGSQMFTVTADDGESENNTYSQTFQLTINSVNDIPAFTLSGDVSVNEDFSNQLVTVSPMVIPADELVQTIVYSLSPASVSFANVSINSVTGEVSITSIDNAFGSQIFTVTADDLQSENNTYSQSFTLAINSVNDAPLFNLSGDVNVNEDFSTAQHVSVLPMAVPVDELSQTVVYSLSPSSVSFADISFNSSTGEVEILSVPDANGSQLFTITADDGQALNNNYSASFLLNVNSENDAPIFALSGDITVIEGLYTNESVSVSSTFVPADEMSQVVVYSLSPASVDFANVSINSATGEVTITPVQDMFGTQVFTVTADDGQLQNNLYSQTFTLTIDAGNNPPSFTLSGDVIVDEDFSATETVMATHDPVRPHEAGQVVNYSMSPSSVTFANVSINSSTGEVSITSIADAHGSQQFTITADDGQNRNNLYAKTFMLTVNSVNDAPVFTLSGDVNVMENFSSIETMTVSAGFVPADEQSQVVSYSITPASVSFADVSINSLTGEVIIASVQDMFGSQMFTVTANDGQSMNNVHTQTFTLNVNEGNNVPAFSTSGDLTVDEDFSATEVVTITPVALRPVDAGQVVTYSLSPVSASFANVSINSSTGEVIITSIADANGSQMFTITADDGQGVNNLYSQTFMFTVNSVNDAPVFTLSGDVNVMENFSTTETISVSTGFVPADEMNQILSYSLSPGSVGFANVAINSLTGEVTIVSVQDMFGSQMFTVTADDGQSLNNIYTQTFTLTVNEGNNVPAFTTSGDVTVDEDFGTTEVVTITPDALRPVDMGQSVTYSLSPASVSFANVSINSSTGEVIITSIADANGSQMFTITADDGQGINNLYSQTFMFTVNSVNDAPVFTLSADVNVMENFSTTETITVSTGFVPADEMNQILSYSLSPGSVGFANVAINSLTGEVTIVSVQDMFGSQMFTVTADDGQSVNNVHAQTFTLTVNEGNNVPAFSASGDVTVDEDFSTTEVVTISPDALRPVDMGQSVTYSLSPASVSFANVSINSATGEVAITSIANANGSQMFTITADDGQSVNNLYSQSFMLTINSVNDAPLFAHSGDIMIDEDFSTTEVVAVAPGFVPADEIGQAVSYSLSPASVSFANVSINSSTGEVTITSVADANGSQMFTITADDGEAQNGTFSETFSITVSSVNDAPAFTTSGDVTVDEDFATMQYVTVSPAAIPADEMSQVVTYSLSPSSVSFANVSINSTTGEVMITSVANASGLQMFTITADDGQSVNNLNSKSFMLTVNSVNDAPAFTHSGDINVGEDFATAQQVSVIPATMPADELSQAVTYSLSPLSISFANISINSVTGEVTITSIADASGSQIFTVTANDGQSQNGIYSATFMFTVNPVNDAPIFSINNSITVIKNFTTNETITVVPAPVPADEVLQTVTYSLNPASVSFANISFNSLTGTVSITSINNMSGTQTFTVTADDGQVANNLHSEQFVFTVIDTNYQPELNAINSIAIDEDAGVQIVQLSGISAGFNESQMITVTAISNNPSLIPNPVVAYNSPDNIGTLSFAPAADQNGVAVITVTVDDGLSVNNSITRSFTVTVNPVNDVPTLDVISDVSIMEDASMQSISMSGIYAGPNELQSLTVTAVSSNPSLISNPMVVYNSPAASGVLNYSPAANQYGSALITVTVNDGQSNNNSSSRAFMITVNPVDDLPVLSDVYKNGQEDKDLGFQASNFESRMNDIEGDTLTKINIVSLPANGTLLLNGIVVSAMTEISKSDINVLVYDPATEFAGVDSFVWNGMAGSNYALNSAMVYLNINQVNDKPYVTAHIQDISVNEDASAMLNYVDLDNIFTDIEDAGNMTYTVTMNSNIGLVNITVDTDHMLDISFVENAQGAATVIIQAMDNGSAMISDTFSVAVISVEDMPSAFNLLTPADGSLLSNPTAIDFSWEASTDGDGDVVTYSVVIKGHGLDTTMTGVSVASMLFDGSSLMTPDSVYNWFVIASDGDDSKTSAMFSFKISLTAVKDPYTLVNEVNAYPNPFSSKILISYSLKADAKVTLRILNFLGQEVMTLSNEQQSKGDHKVEWNGNESTSGIYFYELLMESKSGMEGSFVGKIIKN